MIQLSAQTRAHLRDLRNRFLRCLLVVNITVIGLYMYKEPLLKEMLRPLTDMPHAPVMVVYTGVAELFFIYLKITTWGGIFLALPYILWEAWGFISPGLYVREKKLIWPVLLAVPLLFYAGGLFAFYGVVPPALDFFMGYEQPGLTAQPVIREYLAFLFTMSFAFGLAFNLPVFIVLLVRMGLLNVQQLQSQRRLVVVLVFIVATILTPPDPFSQVMMAVPLYALYEFSILWARWLKL